MGKSMNLNNLSPEEAQQILKVIQKDFELRQKERERLSKIEEVVNEEENKTELLTKQQKFNENCCIRCCQTFGFIFNRKQLCQSCRLYICKSCAKYDDNIKGYVCKACLNELELKHKSLDWFYNNVSRKYKRFGSAKVVRTLYKHADGSRVSKFHWSDGDEAVMEEPEHFDELDIAQGMNCGDIRKVKSTLGTFSCQECPSIFLSKNDLKKHKKTAKHDLDLDRVICAFCVQKEQREFRRVGDLRFHIKTKHAIELLDAPEGLLTTRTVFYFALEPLNYLKEHRAEKFDDPAAVYARQLVTRWCTGRTPGVSKWLAGWELAKGSPNTGEKRPSTSLELIDVCIAPKEIKAHFSLGETYLMAKVDLSISEDFRGMDSLSRRQRAIQCSTEIPSGSWKVLNNPETKAESAALLGIQEHYIYVLLHKPKPSFHAKVQKVSETQTHVSPSEAPDAPNTQPASPEGANDDLMQEVMKSCGILPPFSPIPSPPPIHLGPADEGTSNDTEDPFPQVTVLSTSASLSPALPDVMTSFPDASVSTPVALLPSNKSTPPPEVPTVEVVPPPPAVSSDEVVSLPPVVSSNVDVGPPSPVVSTNEVVLPPPAVSRDEIVSPPPAVSSCSSFVEVVPPTNTSQENCPSVVSMSTVSQVMTSSAIDSLPLLSCSSNSCSLFTGTTPVYCCSSVAPTPTYEPTMIGGQRPSEVIYKPTPILSSDIVRQRARTLLTKGCMPLLPPARRDWNVIPDQSIQLCPGLLWPPANWKSMLADQRSLAVEFAALTLLRRTGTTSFFPDRFPLVHQYNFLVLPGSGPYKTDIRGKARVYNYEAVSRIINGQDVSPLSDQMDFLNCFNPGSDYVDQDVLQKISAVPLRLK